ncbi:MAG: M28 family peptidase [Bacteroidota bacterium]
MKYSWILPLSLFLLPVLSIAQSAEEILEKARSEIAILCSDSLGGRGYIDNGHIKAAKYLSHRYEEMGLIPLLESRKTGEGTFLQRFPLEINLSTNARLNIDGKDYQIGEDFIISRNSGYGSAKGKILDLGYGLERQKYARASGRIVLIRNGLPKEIANDSEKKAAVKELSNIQMRISTLSLASPKAIIVLHEKLTAGFSRQLGSVPVIDVQANLKTTKWKKADLKVETGPKRLESQNVIGLSPGKKVRDTVIIVSAHYDHLGKVGSAIFRGANDNASGTSMLLSMAAYFSQKKNQPDYSMLFIAFGGEETGLLGSGFYVQQQAIVPLTQTKFILNLDLMGNGVDGIMAVGGKDYPAQFEKLVQANEELEAVPKVRSRKNAPNSDHYFFLLNGVPGFFIYTLGGPPHYHDVNDTPDTIVLSRYAEVRNLLIKFLKRL